MTSPKGLSTRKCTAEQRAWLLVYQKRIGWGQPLIEAFNEQFPETEPYKVLLQARCVRDADPMVQSELLDLAEQCSWYEEAPQEGESGYKRMIRLEKYKEARQRMKTRGKGGQKREEQKREEAFVRELEADGGRKGAS